MTETTKPLQYQSNQLRVLHVLVCLSGGGVETLLLNLAKMLPSHIHFDYLVTCHGSRDHEAIDSGSLVHYLPPNKQNPFHWASHVGELVNKYHYDVVHFHRFACGGSVLRAAKHNGATVRISHSHGILFQEKSWLKKLIYSPYHWTINRLLLAIYATNIVGCSRDALRFSIGPFWNRLHKCRVVFNGIPLTEFDKQMAQRSRELLCRQYDIPDDAIVIGNFGRLDPVKNHAFLIDIFSILVQRNPHYFLLIGGEGELRTTLEEKIKQRQLQNRVRMPGQCTNAPELFGHLFDCFVLPSRAEGFGIVIAEAIAGGLHVICSDKIPGDIRAIFAENLSSLSLSASPKKWADAIEKGIHQKQSPAQGQKIIEHAAMDFSHFAQEMIAMYENGKK